MGDSGKIRELSDRLKRKLNTGESVYFSDASQYRTKASPDGKWVAKVRRVERGKLVTFAVRSYAKPDDAVEYAESTRPQNRKAAAEGQAIAKIRHGANAVTTVADLYRYCRDHTWKRLSGRRIAEKEARWVNHIEPYWGSWPLPTVRSKAAQEWVTEKEADLIDGKGLSQLSECRFDLMGYFRTGIKLEFYEWANPFEDLDFTPPTPRALTTIESKDFANILYTMNLLVEHGLALQWAVDMFTVSLLTGMREGEVLGLRGKCIALDERAILVDRALIRKGRNVNEDGVPYGGAVRLALGFPKGGHQADPKARFVAIPDQLMPMMRRLRASGEGLVFGGEDGKLKEIARFHGAWRTLRSRMADVVRGEQTRRHATQEVIAILASSGIVLPDIWEKIDYRDTRNSFASYAAEVSVTEPARMALLGHEGTTVTFRRYTDLTNLAFKKAQKQLSRGWNPTF